MSVVGFLCEYEFSWVFVLQCVCRGRGSAGLMAAPLVGEQGTKEG